MEHYRSNTKLISYYERQKKKKKLYPRRYRYYFFDYLYYCGEEWHEKGASRSSGLLLLFFYWTFCVAVPFYVYLCSIIETPVKDVGNFTVLVLFSFVPPTLLGVLRYRGERRSAIMSHYRRSAWNKGILVSLVCSAWFPLWLIQMWLLKDYIP